MAFRYFRRKPALQNNGLLLLQIATRFSKWGKHVAKKTVVPFKGCRSSEHGLLYIHTPSGWCTLQCIILCKRREIFFFLSPNTLSFLIFQESICAKLGGTMKVLEIKWFNFINFTTPSMTKYFIYKNWCQNHFWLNRVIDWGGEWFQTILSKYHQVTLWICSKMYLVECYVPKWTYFKRVSSLNIINLL